MNMNMTPDVNKLTFSLMMLHSIHVSRYCGAADVLTIQLSNFEKDRSIMFSPPDGEFELMKYRTSDGVQLPFKIMPSIKEISKDLGHSMSHN